MLRAATSLRLTSPCAAASTNALSRNSFLTPRLQQRNYIFLPASFQELQHLIQEAWSSQKERRRIIWVKLWQRPKELTEASLQTSRNKRKALSIKTRYFRMKQEKSYLNSKRRFLNAKRLFREQAAYRMTSFRGNMRHLWKWQSLSLTEPAQLDWFDAEGYPKAVRDEYGRFVNPWNSQSTNGMQSLWLFFQWRMERLYNTFFRTSLPPSTTTQPVTALDFQTTPPPENQIRCTWLGHSTTLVEVQGFTVLTDPIFSERTDPWPMGVARLASPPCQVQDLPNIDVCVISHDHYDHLDQSTVEELKDKIQYWAVPSGMSAWLQDYCDISAQSILEMTWWESTSLKRSDTGDLQVALTPTNNKDELELVCVPAQHWCGRNMLDRNYRLWCSWVVRSGPLKFFFAGDTALPESFPLHRQIGDRLGPFDVAALPIGAYDPSYFMNVSHVHPREAVKIHQDLQVDKSMAIHWGTFALSEEEHDEPPRLLKEAAEEAGIDFVAVPQGDCIVGPVEEEAEDVVVSGGTTEMDESQQDERIEYG